MMLLEPRNKDLRILIVARHNDPHAQAVCWGLRQLGFSPTIWFWSDFPKLSTSTIRINSQQVPFLSLTSKAHQELGAFDVIWMRRKGKPEAIAGGHPDDEAIIIEESEKFIKNVLPFLGHANTRWINRSEADSQCESKLYQLVIAKEIGFRIPDTLIGNDVNQVRAFFDSHHEQVVHKGFSQVKWENEDGSQTVARTSALQREHLSNDYSILACPAIYQEHIQKKYELRVTVMGNRAIAGAIYSQQDGPTVDWRCEGGRGNTNLKAIVLDPEIEQKCLALCRKLNLAFGCIDLIVTPKDEVVFLEINCAGQFLFKEYADPSLPMLDAFCRFVAFGDSSHVEHGSTRLSMINYGISEEGLAARLEYVKEAEKARLEYRKKYNAT